MHGIQLDIEMLETQVNRVKKVAVNKGRSKRKFKVVSLFSGCGGFDLGLLGGFSYLGRKYSKNPFDIIWANELNPAACETYKKNVSSHIHCGDIWDLVDSVPSSGEVDVVIGGFPCQDISINGKGLGVKGSRSGLYRAMVEVVERTKPKVFIAENVKGLLMKHNQDSLEVVLEDFSNLGYNVSYKLYNAADFGVAQLRERVFIVGTRKDIPKFMHPAPTHSKDSWVSARDAVLDLESIGENEVNAHVWSRAKRSPDQGNRVLKAQKPAHTMRAECHGNIQFHYLNHRRISMREAARFQSFPDGFEFVNGLRQTEREIGNAVPPVLAWHIMKALAEQLR